MAPQKCSWLVARCGKHVLTVHSGTAEEIELFIRSIKGVSGQRVDWYYGAGLAIVLAMGNLTKVAEAAHQLKSRFKLVAHAA